MNSVASAPQHVDNGLRTVPAVDLADGIDLAHEFAFDLNAEFELVAWHVVFHEWLGRFPQNTPVHIWAQALAANTCEFFDVRAKLDRRAVLLPLIGGLP